MGPGGPRSPSAKGTSELEAGGGGSSQPGLRRACRRPEGLGTVVERQFTKDHAVLGDEKDSGPGRRPVGQQDGDKERAGRWEATWGIRAGLSL